MEKIAKVILIWCLFALAGEGVVRAWVYIHPYYDIEMWRYGKDFKIKSPDPQMAFQHKPFAHGKLYGVDISINSRGLRDREFSEYPAKGTSRALFLGDSLTLGWGVPYEDTFSKRLEKPLSQRQNREVEVINTGIGNYNTQQEMAYYRDEGFKFHPNEVWVLYFINDTEPTPIYRPIQFWENSMMVVYFWAQIEKVISRMHPGGGFIPYYKSLYVDANPGLRVAKESFLDLKRITELNHAHLKVFVCPELHQFVKSYPFESEQKMVVDFLKENKIDSLDLLPYFKKGVKNERDVWVSLEDAHPNSLGHKIISDAILSEGLHP